MNSVEDIKTQFESFIKEYEKFSKGNASAGTRARKALGEVSKLCKVVRGEITEEKNSRKLENKQ